MRIEFEAKLGGPERLVAEAAIVFDDDGLLEGMKLVGFSIWRSADDEVFVTFPSRAWGAGGERRFFDYLRSTNATPDAVKATKEAIVEAWRTRKVEA